jgi:Ca-activated chloride channel family protein
VRFTELDLLASVAPQRPGWRRHVPAGLLLLSLVALTTAWARPQAQVDVVRERATVVVALDVSASMMATDVEPNRISAAKASARAFVERLPARFNIGLVSFAGSAQVVAPTQDHAEVTRGIDGLQLAGGTAIGDAVRASLQAVSLVPGEPGQAPPPARIVLLSDGANTVGTSVASAEQQAQEAGVPVSTIAYGTQDGVVQVQGQQIPVPVDREALAALGEATGGKPYTAESGEQLDGVYEDIGSQVGTTKQRREVTSAVTGLGLLLALGAAVTALLWSPRFP